MSGFNYIGGELDLFAGAHNWKSYWSSQIQPLISGDVLEVGAGIGSNTPFLDTGERGRWVCLEPDARLLSNLTLSLSRIDTKRSYEAQCGTLQSLADGMLFDTIIYVDVLEHIEDDVAEIARAKSRLRDGGTIIVLSPAHQWLFSRFDAAIGHFRRYNQRSIAQLTCDGLRLKRCFYLDSVGLLLSLSNRFLRQSMPTRGQLAIWDKLVVPLSRAVDPVLRRSWGKTIVAAWIKSNELAC
jgi:SAM-dependent methyltransferase